METLETDSGRLTPLKTLKLFPSTLLLICRDYKVLLPASILTATGAFVIQHFVNAKFEPGYHFMDGLCYFISAFCRPSGEEDVGLGGHVSEALHTIADFTSFLLTHAASCLIDLAICSIVLAPLLRLIAIRVDSLVSYSSNKSTRPDVKQLALAWKDHVIVCGAILVLGLASLLHGVIPGFSGLSSVALPFSCLGMLMFSVAPTGFARGHNYMSIAQVAFFHKPLPMLIFVLCSAPLLLLTPMTFLCLPFFVGVCTQVYACLIVDPDQQTEAGSALNDVGLGIQDVFRGKTA